MGDIILMVPALNALRKALPKAEIHVAIDENFAGVLDDQGIDRIITLGNKRVDKIALAVHLYRTGYDCVINFHGGPTSAWLTAACGAPRRIGRDTYRFGFIYNCLATVPEKDFIGPDTVHTVQHQAFLASALGFPVEDFSCRLSSSAISRDLIKKRLHKMGVENNGYTLLQPTASFASKQWPADRFLKLAHELRQRTGQEVVVSLPASVPKPHQQSRIMRAILPVDRLASRTVPSSPSDPDSLSRLFTADFPVLTGLPLNELMALLDLARLYIGNDSGPMHIAAAMGKPVVAIFGSSNPRRWYPWDVPHRVIWAGLDCSPCHGKKCANPQQLACLKRLEVDRVLEAVLELTNAPPLPLDRKDKVE